MTRRGWRPSARTPGVEPEARSLAAADRWGDLPLIADTSAWIWVPRAPAEIKSDFAEAVRSGQIRTSALVKLELLYGTADRTEFEQRDAQLAALEEVRLSRYVGDAAVGALRELKDRGSPGYHKVKLPDALIAAAAAERGFNVLHYDRDYDRLEQVLNFTAMRLAPQGSLR